jgi:hypothetical protein
MTPVIISLWITDIVRRFQKVILNSSIFTGEPPHLEAQPPHMVAKYKSNPNFIFPFLFIFIFISIYYFLIGKHFDFAIF